jgi:SagB-type dehydrogenase family enzyme
MVCVPDARAAEPSPEAAKIVLPKPALDGAVSVEKALNERRSLREYSSAPIDMNQLSQLLWAAGGISSKRGLRTAPSAGALYPLEFYAAAGNVKDLAAGLYKYDCAGHDLVKISEGDKRDALYSSCLGQAAVKNAPLVIIITADYKRTSVKYGARAERYVHMEAGHASQNICLQAVSLKAATVPVGAFDDAAVKKALGLPDNEVPLYIMPVGLK